MTFKYLSIAFVLMAINTPGLTQTFDTLYSVNTEFGVGYGRFISDLDLNGLNKNGYNLTFRILWQPEHFLSIGLESGYLKLYSYEEKGIETGFRPYRCQGLRCILYPYWQLLLCV